MSLLIIYENLNTMQSPKICFISSQVYIDNKSVTHGKSVFRTLRNASSSLTNYLIASCLMQLYRDKKKALEAFPNNYESGKVFYSLLKNPVTFHLLDLLKPPRSANESKNQN